MAAFHQSDAALSGECWYTFPGKKAYPIEEWREMNFGAYEGKNYEDLKMMPIIRNGLTAMAHCLFRKARASRNI